MKPLLLITAMLCFANSYSQKARVGNRTNSLTVDYQGNDKHEGLVEVGTVMHIQKSPALIRYVNFVIKANNYKDSIDFNINIYSLKNGLPEAGLLKEPITVTSKMKKGVLTLNVEKYNIYVKDDFFLALQWKEGKNPERIGFGGGTSGNKSYHRVDNGEWDKLPIMKLGFFADVLYVSSEK